MTSRPEPETESGRPGDGVRGLKLEDCIIALVVFLAHLTFFQIYGQYHQDQNSDYIRHIELYQRGAVRHVMFHSTAACLATVIGIGLKTAFMATAAIYAFVSTCITYLILRTLSPLIRTQAWVFACLLSVMAGAWLPAFSGDQIYLGQGSPNIFHNPTYLACKPFSLLAVLYFMLGYRSKSVASFSLGLAFAIISIFGKPSFALIFFPSVWLLLGISTVRNWKKRADKPASWMYLFSIFATLVAVALISEQSSAHGAFGSGQAIKVAPFEAWKLYSKAPAVSLLLGNCFPLCLLLLGWKRVIRDAHLQLAWVQMVVGVTLMAVFAEDGDRFSHFNFSWPYLSAQNILLVFSFAFLSKAFDNFRSRDKVFLGLAIAWQAISGIAMIQRLLSAGNYH